MRRILSVTAAAEPHPVRPHTKVHDLLGLYQRGYLEISDTLWRWVNLAIWMQTFFAGGGMSERGVRIGG